MTKNTSVRFIFLSGAAFALGSVLPPTVPIVMAQQFAVEEITVTARRREERLQDIPLAITAFTAQDINNAGIQDLNDLALQTAGMQFDSRSSGNRTPGRINSVIRLRGVTQGTLDHLQPTSVFIDGIYVLGTAGTMGLQDLERVEVIKGPQSAFFGRNTFAGAINYITKTPSLDDYETNFDFSMATYEKFDGNIMTSGPIIPGKLAFQFNGRLYNRGPEWQTTDGGELGQESSSFASLMLYGEPNENMSFKLRAYYQYDDDKSPVAGIIRGRFADTCTGTSIERFTKPAPPGRPFLRQSTFVVKSRNSVMSNKRTPIIPSPAQTIPCMAQGSRADRGRCCPMKPPSISLSSAETCPGSTAAPASFPFSARNPTSLETFSAAPMYVITSAAACLS